MTPRLPDWSARLEAFVQSCRGRTHTWSTFDCATFALGAVDVMCGTTHAAELVGQYASAAGARAYAGARGWSTLADAVFTYGGTPIPARVAERGDVLWMPPLDASHPCFEHGLGGLLVVLGDRCVSPATNCDGLQWVTRRLPVQLGARAFAIGRTP